jgi:hypothetical protein
VAAVPCSRKASSADNSSWSVARRSPAAVTAARITESTSPAALNAALNRVTGERTIRAGYCMWITGMGNRATFEVP